MVILFLSFKIYIIIDLLGLTSGFQKKIIKTRFWNNNNNLISLNVKVFNCFVKKKKTIIYIHNFLELFKVNIIILLFVRWGTR